MKVFSIDDVIVGDVYKHFKGNFYKITGVATHTETLEPLVLYSLLGDSKTTWARPLPEFFGETTDIKGEKITRFTKVGGIYEQKI